MFRLLPNLAQDSGDYPVRTSDRPLTVRGQIQNGSGRLDPANDPSYCCEAHEQLADRLREFGGAAAVGKNVASAFERRIRALDVQCPKGVTLR